MFRMMDSKVCIWSLMLARHEPIWTIEFRRAYVSISNCVCAADPSAELDVVETNKRFIQNSEELYDALIDSQWKSPEFSSEQDQVMLTIPDPLGY